MTVDEIFAQFKSLGNDARRAHNTKAGAPDNQFGVKLGDIRAMAKKIKTDHVLALTLWDTGKPIKPILPQGVPTWQDDEAIPMTSLHPFASGKVEVKMKVIGFDAADGQSLAEAEIFARRQMIEIDGAFEVLPGV